MDNIFATAERVAAEVKKKVKEEVEWFEKLYSISENYDECSEKSVIDDLKKESDKNWGLIIERAVLRALMDVERKERKNRKKEHY